MDVSYDYLLFNYLAVWNLHGIIMSLLCKLLDAGFITIFFQSLLQMSNKTCHYRG